MKRYMATFEETAVNPRRVAWWDARPASTHVDDGYYRWIWVGECRENEKMVALKCIYRLSKASYENE